MNRQDGKNILETVFETKHVDATLLHFKGAIEKYQRQDWEGVCLKSGKFVEAVTKLLMAYCGVALPPTRSFHAGRQLRNLEQLNSATLSDTVRIVIPKGGIFIYEIVNNRGRHDTDEIDANEMDAQLLIPAMSWVLGEMIRFASKGADPLQAMELVDSISSRVYPFFEEIDGKIYINISGLSAENVALLILYFTYPKRLSRQDLISLLVKDHFKQKVAGTAVHRVKSYVDENEHGWKLRTTGKIKAEEIISKIKIDPLMG